jgi:membrane protein
MTLRETGCLLSMTYAKWSAHNAPRLGAALAYYSLLSAAPILILVIEICGLVLNRTVAEQQLFRHTAGFIGPGAADTLRAAIDKAHHKTGILASSLAGVTLFLGASGVFVELREALNTIWDAPPPRGSAIWSMIMQRLGAFIMILAFGIFVAASLLLSTAFAVVEKYFADIVPMHLAIFGEVGNFVVSVVIVALLFGLIFKFVPNLPIHWKDVSFGAFVSGVLFILGKSALTAYLTTAGVGSAYGAAGTIVAFVAWMYYSAQIFLFGAVFTRIYADHYGSYAKHRRNRLPEARQAAAGGNP